MEVYIEDLNNDDMSTAQFLEEELENHKYLSGEVGKVEMVEITYEDFDNGINRSTNNTLDEYRKLFKRNNKKSSSKVKETKFIKTESSIFPTSLHCENCVDKGDLVILVGWEEYCPICGYKITNKQEINQ